MHRSRKREEITTEGGLNLKFKSKFLKEIINKLKKNKSRVSLFIEPSLRDIKTSKLFKADCVEIHTGKLCNLINQNKRYSKELQKIKKAVDLGNKLGLEVHAGHGLTFQSAKILSRIRGIKEFNIGHFLIGESIFLGLGQTIKKFKKNNKIMKLYGIGTDIVKLVELKKILKKSLLLIVCLILMKF